METIKKEQTKLFYADYLLSRQLIHQGCVVHQQIDTIYQRHIDESRAEVTSKINKMIYDLAEKQGRSVYDICLSTIPDVIYDPISTDGCRFNMNATIILRPIQLELEKGPGYWKRKYYALKDKMRALIDSKTDE